MDIKMINLLVQLDTFQNDKIKAILKTGEESISKLQEEHCFEFQLVAKSDSSANLIDELINTSSPYKTKYGKNWYEFDIDGLTKVINIFLKSGGTFVDLKIISSIFGFSFELKPLIKKEVKIEDLSEKKEKNEKLVEKKEIETILKEYGKKEKKKK